MSDEHTDEIFREIQAELRLTPSPAFPANVRARIAGAPARAWFGDWRVALTSAAVLGVAVMAVVMWGRAGARREITPAPAVPSVASPLGARTLPPRVRTPVAVAARTAPGPDLTPVVPPDERIALNHLLVALKSGRAFVPPAESLLDDATGALKPLVAIDVPPIVVEPLPGTASGGGTGRGIR